MSAPTARGGAAGATAPSSPWNAETTERLRTAPGQVRPLTRGEREALMHMHNTARAQVGAKPLVWDERLANFAAMYAGQCRLEHWRDTDYPYPRDMQKNGPPDVVMGENIAWSCPRYGFDGKSAAQRGVEQWLEELPNYDCENDVCLRGQCGHYTQMLWPTSERVGCAIVKCGGPHGNGERCRHGGPGFEALYCEYSPVGNVVCCPRQRAVPDPARCPARAARAIPSFGVLARHTIWWNDGD